MDKVTLALAVGFVIFCAGKAIARIINASGGNSKYGSKVRQLEVDIADMEQDLEDTRQRIEVLEKIVTDDSNDLRKQIDGL